MRPKNQPGIPCWKGEALRVRRLAANWSTEALANRVGVSKSTLIRWELGRNAPTSANVADLAEALDVPRAVFARTPRII
jgi:transcriptional regulator with XRE-family HTH domain